MVFDLLDELLGRGVAILGVFHDPDAIRRPATRVITLHDGRMAVMHRMTH